jgi:molybdopterin molybdotransferase
MIAVEEALAMVIERTPVLSAETVPLGMAWGRVLRSSVVADRDLPPFDRAAMDGFAVRSQDVSRPPCRLNVTGEVRAGTFSDRTVGLGEAFRIMTGAPVPSGADAVIQVERTSMVDTGTAGAPVVQIEVAVTAGQNMVRRGTEATQGALLLPEGTRVSAAHLAVLASVGVAEPLVSRRPRVAVIVTGDEVVDMREQPAPAQIRNANGPALLAAVTEAGGDPKDFGVVPDEPDRTRMIVEQALADRYDAIILSGGVSAGAFDFVEPALLELGVTIHITAVRVKPGAPFVFGTRGETMVFGLPGNPVSAQVTFELFVRPSLLKMQSARALARPRLEAVLQSPLVNRSGRTNYLPVRVVSVSGALHADPVRTQGSGDVAAHSLANALAVLEPDRTAAAAGDRVILYPLSSFLEV